MFPTPGGESQVSSGGGVAPRWRSGKELFYYAADGQLMAVPMRLGDKAVQVGAPVPLFKARMLLGPVTSLGFNPQYDVTADGQRFLLNVPVDDSISSVTVVLNWTAGSTGK